MASRAETLAKQCEAKVQEALHQENAAAAAAIVRGLSDAQVDTTGTDEHLGSIRTTVGR